MTRADLVLVALLMLTVWVLWEILEGRGKE